MHKNGNAVPSSESPKPETRFSYPNDTALWKLPLNCTFLVERGRALFEMYRNLNAQVISKTADVEGWNYEKFKQFMLFRHVPYSSFLHNDCPKHMQIIKRVHSQNDHIHLHLVLSAQGTGR